jgi:predicted alpha/beta hydrolase
MVGTVAHYVCVKTETVHFFSEGARLRGFLHRPDGDALGFPSSCRALVGSASLTRISTCRTTRPSPTPGFAVLIFDYRGFGESEGRPRIHLADVAARGLA